MKKPIEDDPLAPRDLDWSKAVRGKYHNLLAEGTNIAVIDPDLMESFPDSESVNKALRAFLDISARLHAVNPRQRNRAA
jgi:hypothetical protein